ncbi:MAG: grdB [Firmicutes bacterium]|nr:grdB [Bacillota bacterium]
MTKLKVVHYLNQFFGQIGGEDHANITPLKKTGPIGPGLALKSALADQAEVVGTIICGDSYFAENMDTALKEIITFIKEYNPDLFISGPAFNAGRYGTACGAVAAAVEKELGIPAVTGMYIENPGADLYKKFIYIISTANSAIGMKAAIPKMAKLALKLANKEPLSTPEAEGYITRGIRKNFFTSETGAKRAVNMLVNKITGQPFTSELIMPTFDRVPPNPPVKDIRKATIALVTSGGIVPTGNPSHIESSSASKFGKYSLVGIVNLTPTTFQTAHGGYDPTYANQDADRVLPVDVLREMERLGAIGKLHDYYYATVGNGTSVANAALFGKVIAGELRNDGVDAVILTST